MCLNKLPICREPSRRLPVNNSGNPPIFHHDISRRDITVGEYDWVGNVVAESARDWDRLAVSNLCRPNSIEARMVELVLASKGAYTRWSKVALEVDVPATGRTNLGAIRRSERTELSKHGSQLRNIARALFVCQIQKHLFKRDPGNTVHANIHPTAVVKREQRTRDGYARVISDEFERCQSRLWVQCLLDPEAVGE